MLRWRLKIDIYLSSTISHLEQVSAVLQKNQLYLKASKCTFAQDSLEYLGHIISSKGVGTNASKIQAMLHYPVQISVTELRAFFGLAGYYRWFVWNYGIMEKSLTQLLRLKQFQWGQGAQHAFDELKVAMTKTPVLALPDFQQPFTVEMNAC